MRIIYCQHPTNSNVICITIAVPSGATIATVKSVFAVNTNTDVKNLVAVKEQKPVFSESILYADSDIAPECLTIVNIDDKKDEKKDAKELKFDAWFQKFSKAHSWYKHIIGERYFVPCPISSNEWTFCSVDNLDLNIKNPKIREILLKHTFPVSPFVYPAGLVIIHTLGNAGFPIFDWMDKMGYNDESKYIRSHCQDNSAAKDDRYKITFTGDAKNPAIIELYKKEYERIKALALVAFKGVIVDLKHLKESSATKY